MCIVVFWEASLVVGPWRWRLKEQDSCVIKSLRALERFQLASIGRERVRMGYDRNSSGNRAFIWKRSSLERETSMRAQLWSTSTHTHTHSRSLTTLNYTHCTPTHSNSIKHFPKDADSKRNWHIGLHHSWRNTHRLSLYLPLSLHTHTHTHTQVNRFPHGDRNGVVRTLMMVRWWKVSGQVSLR